MDAIVEGEPGTGIRTNIVLPISLLSPPVKEMMTVIMKISIPSSSASSGEERDWYLQKLGALAEVSSAYIDRVKSFNDEEFSDCVAWTGKESTHILLQCRRDAQTGGVQSLLSLLLVSSHLERALGNVYWQMDRSVPIHMRDLLSSPHLKAIFEPDLMEMLQVLVGPPVSLNLRNLVWHGFLSPSEAYPVLPLLLIHAIMELGSSLQRHTDINIIPRPPAVVSSEIPSCPTLDLQVYLKDILSSPYVMSEMKCIWLAACEYALSQRYGESIILLLPQLECSLRILYCEVNGLPGRIITAEQDSLYLTFDEMMLRPKKLARLLPSNIMEMLLDLLIYPEGPRIRDRISHAELDLIKNCLLIFMPL
ncbi:unnamed protein product [Darwinula stevensoni]|uniref:DUF4209 domain-containing protein n=1 Tax=Darwinula stevensoni TaxID=69355 RepID=A0A7R9A5H7_9CRUS|nr:unnamed protein product [Darwinula stevensoni]CAG0886512.1 unnamed protein product [Darwinula stevensoni]